MRHLIPRRRRRGTVRLRDIGSRVSDANPVRLASGAATRVGAGGGRHDAKSHCGPRDRRIPKPLGARAGTRPDFMTQCRPQRRVAVRPS